MKTVEKAKRKNSSTSKQLPVPKTKNAPKKITAKKIIGNSKKKTASTSAQSLSPKTKNAPKKTSVSQNKLSKKSEAPSGKSRRIPIIMKTKLQKQSALKAGPNYPAKQRITTPPLSAYDSFLPRLEPGDSKHGLKTRKDEENWLEKSNLLFHLNPASIVLISLPDRKLIDVNEACLKTFGFSKKEIIGKTCDKLNVFVQLEKRQNALEQLLKRGYIDNYELKVRRKDGTIIDGLFSGEIIESQGKMYVIVIMIDQTSRKISEKAQRESEEKYRTILESTEEGYYEIDLAGNFTFFNDSICRILGYSKEELMGMNNRQYTDKETAKKVFKAFNKVYITGEPTKEFDWQIIRKDGTKRYIEQSASLIQKDSSGKPIGFRGIIHDITKRKQTEEALGKIRDLLNETGRLAKIGGWEVDVKTQEQVWTEEVYRICEVDMNYKPTAREVIDYYTPASRPVIKRAMQRAIVHGEPFDVELEIMTAKGNLRWVHAIGKIDQEHGKVFGTFQDITERKNAEEAMKQSEEKYRLLADHMKDQVWLMDLNLKVTYISPSVEKLFGYTLEELRDISLNKLLSPTSLKIAGDFYSTELSKALATTSNHSLKRLLELEFICKNGQILWIESTFSFIRDDNGKPLAILGEGREITKRKQIEDYLQKSEENFRHSLDDSPLGVRISTTEGETIYANRAVLDIYKYNSIEELNQTPTKERYTPESYAQFMTRKEKRLRGEFGPSEYEISIVRKNGEIRHLHVFRKEIFWNGKKQSQVIYQDITLRKQAEEKLTEILGNLRKSIRTTIQVLGTASEARDPYTAGHQKRVADLARTIATEMGLPHDSIEGIRMAGAIHDIGKISIPSEILCKPTKLTDLEFSLVKAHTQYSYEIMKDVESPWPLADIVHQHHERINGSGYPQGLKGENILIEARILAVADVVEAMVSYRPYRPSLGIEIALTEIEKNAGILYDRKVVDTCLKLFREKGFSLA